MWICADQGSKNMERADGFESGSYIRPFFAISSAYRPVGINFSEFINWYSVNRKVPTIPNSSVFAPTSQSTLQKMFKLSRALSSFMIWNRILAIKAMFTQRFLTLFQETCKSGLPLRRRMTLAPEDILLTEEFSFLG